MIKITADSMCDLAPQFSEKYNVGIIPIHVALGDNDYLDGVTIKPEYIYNYYEGTKKLPKTGACSQVEYEEFFRQYTDNGDVVIHFNISERISSCYRNALAAAEKLGNVYVVDSRSLSGGMGVLVLDACDMAAVGMSAEEIFRREQQLAYKVSASFVVDTLEFLHKGGRCSSVAYLGANLLQIKPCIDLTDGAMVMGKKYRGRMPHVFAKYIADTFAQHTNPCKKRCIITHTKVSDEIREMALQSIAALNIFDEILDTTAGCSVTTHCGEGTLGVFFIDE